MVISEAGFAYGGMAASSVNARKAEAFLVRSMCAYVLVCARVRACVCACIRIQPYLHCLYYPLNVTIW
jgi:hypothetical protein